MSTETQAFDFDARYENTRQPGIAWRFTKFGEDVEEHDVVVCPDEDCDHALSEMCWTLETEEVIDFTTVVGHMVGDDPRSTSRIEIEDLRKLTDEESCGSCGQVGCGHDGR